jgi:hypothetical protein
LGYTLGDFFTNSSGHPGADHKCHTHQYVEEAKPGQANGKGRFEIKQNH